jgi:hypothetical protein
MLYFPLEEDSYAKHQSKRVHKLRRVFKVPD